MAVKWVAELAHVREVSLLGTADLAFWKDQLLKQNLLPSECDGRAQLLITAADLKYMGFRFRELSFSVLSSPPEDKARQDAAYLLHAFNSNRSFAFVERVFFSTPYYYGDVRVSASLPALIHLVKRGEVVFRAEMGVDGSGQVREPARRGMDGWEGPVYLPQKRSGKGRPGKLLFARIRGDTRTYPFLPSQDSLSIGRSPGNAVLQALSDSHFVVKEWNIREDGTHAKSKTYKRTTGVANDSRLADGTP